MKRKIADTRKEELAPVWAARFLVVHSGATGWPPEAGARSLGSLVRADEVKMMHDDNERGCAPEPAREVPQDFELLSASQRLTAAAVAGDLAHELGTPLNVILGRATLALRDAGETEKLAHHLRVIVDQTHRMTGILRRSLERLRQASPMEGGRISVQRLVTRSIRHTAPMARERGVKLVSGEVDPIALYGDEAALELALSQLLAARVGALARNTILTVRAARARGSTVRGAPNLPMVQLDIDDEVPPLAAALTAPGAGVDVDPGPVDGSEPLGWLVCREVLRRHGGRLEVTSGAQGTSVQVFLPEGES